MTPTSTGNVHTVNPYKGEVGRIKVSVSVATEDEAAAFLNKARTQFKPARWHVHSAYMRQNLHRGVHGQGRRPWRVELQFVSEDWIRDEEDRRRKERGR